MKVELMSRQYDEATTNWARRLNW